MADSNASSPSKAVPDLKPVLFGDVFGTHSDYTKGTFYSGRRQYLSSQPNANLLAPPLEFQTKKQARNSARDKAIVLKTLHFPKKDIEEIITAKFQTKKQDLKTTNKKKDKKAQSIVYIETYSSTDPSDWDEVFQAGIQLWINHKTGEVSRECPWGDSLDSFLLTAPRSDERVENMDAMKNSKKDDGSLDGTGALVYDSQAFAELLDILDKKS